MPKCSRSESPDYDDVKLKIVQNEGYDAHDFNLFDDHTATLFRKPYVDGAARELTAGDDRSVDQLRQAVERLMVRGREKSPKVKVAAHPAQRSRANVSVTLDEDHQDEILEDAHRKSHEMSKFCFYTQ